MEVFAVKPADADEKWGETLTHFFATIEEAEAFVAEASRMNERSYLIECAEKEGVRCSVPGCTEVSSAKNPSRYPYCRSCHYTGQAAEHQRESQMEYFADRLRESGGSAGIWHTGGGCMMLGIQFEGTEEHYGCTMFDAILPEDDDGNPVRDEWGLVCWYRDEEQADDGWELLHDSGYPDEKAEKPARLTDEQLMDLVLKHRSERLVAQPA